MENSREFSHQHSFAEKCGNNVPPLQLRPQWSFPESRPCWALKMPFSPRYSNLKLVSDSCLVTYCIVIFAPKYSNVFKIAYFNTISSLLKEFPRSTSAQVQSASPSLLGLVVEPDQGKFVEISRISKQAWRPKSRMCRNYQEVCYYN